MDRETAELTNLRQEILERVKGLHALINTATYISASFLIAGFFIQGLFGGEALIWFLLLMPLVFASLTFNYQANQMTMEAVASYLASKEPSGSWEEFYSQRKKRVQLTSFLKILPLLLPQILPLVLWLLGIELGTLQQLLASIDVVFFLIVIFNFRYKLFQG